MDMEETFQAAVVGGGVAGYAAALTLKNLGVRTLWLGDECFGEKIRLAETVRNYPAVRGTGKTFYAMLEEQRAAEGVAFTEARADGVYKAGENFVLTAGKNAYTARAVVLCTGVERAGDLPGEREFLGRGVSYCAVCDGALYRGKDVAALLYSEKFAPEAEYLAGFARTVHVFSRTACAFPQENIIVHGGLPAAVSGGARVEKVVYKGEEIPVAGVFFLKNSLPPQALVGGLETENGHVKVARDLSTNLKGLFAAGDVTGAPYQYAKAAGEGVVAAHSVRRYLREG